MMRHYLKGVSIGAITLLYVCVVQHVHAAEVSFQVVTNPVPNESVTIVEAYIDTKESALNALEGTIMFTGDGVHSISDVFIETGDSVFSLWPVVPAYAKDEYVVRFTGGSVEGIPKEGTLFRMRIFSKEPEDITISWVGGSGYKNDGKGTPEGISSRSLSIALSPSTFNPMRNFSLDTVPPSFDTVEVSRDPDVFDGNYFVSFHANDDVSGVASYEVVEGQKTTQVSDGIYVLLDQDRQTKVVVTAYDHAGNSTAVRVPVAFAWRLEIAVGGVLLLAVLLFFFMRKRTRL